MKKQDAMTERAYAKINLHLDITERRPDGFHSVQTVMQSVSLCDHVTVTLGQGRFFATCNVEGVPSNEKNIAVKAAMLFCETTGLSLGGEIHIEKHIPMAAGMAGGSTDGAAVLRILNRLCGEPLSMEALCALGAKLGADVPFCIVGGTAYADGKGDVLHPFVPMLPCHLVVACEGEGVSTPWGYGLIDRHFGNFDVSFGYRPKGLDGLCKAIEQGSAEAMCKHMYNIFEEPVLAERPVAARVKEMLLSCGAIGAMMSGSGPSVFGVFTDREKAEKAAEVLREHGWTPYVCEPVREMNES